MKENKGKKLTLNRITLRNLTPNELYRVVGGLLSDQCPTAACIHPEPKSSVDLNP